MHHQEQRIVILKALYDARETQPKKGWIYAKDLRDLAGECDFALGYLVERGLVKANSYQYRITADGMDSVEAAQND